MLFQYQQQLQRLMHDTHQVNINLQDATFYINDARVQIALAAECIRQPGSFDMVAGQQPYPFTGMTLIAAPTLPPGLGGVGNVRRAYLSLFSGGRRRLEMRAWEWFDTYWLSVSAPVPGQPQITSRLQPGLNGTLWFAPPPDAAYPILIDAVAYPAPLAGDGDPEALPQPWTDAVPFYAAYLAALSMQQPDAAAAMWAEYQKFETRGTQLTTPSVMPRSYPGGRGAATAASRTTLTGPPAMLQRGRP
jgi:hypothetical protein